MERFNARTRRFRFARRDGFTVLEAAVATVFLAVGLLSMAAVVPMLKSDLVKSDQRSRAVFLAQETAEWLHGLNYNDPVLLAGTFIDTDFEVEGYERSWTVQDDIPISGVKRVTVEVKRAGQSDGDNKESATVVFLHARAGRS